MPLTSFNKNGRGYPDVSAIGAITFPTYTSQLAAGGPDPTSQQPYLIPIGGTSLACPIFASVIALINDQRIKNKLPTLGFINPLLYTAPSGSFHDITQQGNIGCGANGQQGFNTAVGWDPGMSL